MSTVETLLAPNKPTVERRVFIRESGVRVDLVHFESFLLLHRSLPGRPRSFVRAW